MNRKILSVGAAAVVLAALTGGASAHHSFAMFDNQKEVVLDGVVKEFQWTNPHSWVQVLVTDAKTGKTVEWSIETSSPNSLARQGWKRSSIKAGDKVTAVVNPLKDGQPGGNLVRLKLPDGLVLGKPEAPKPAG